MIIIIIIIIIIKHTSTDFNTPSHRILRVSYKYTVFFQLIFGSTLPAVLSDESICIYLRPLTLMLSFSLFFFAKQEEEKYKQTNQIYANCRHVQGTTVTLITFVLGCKG